MRYLYCLPWPPSANKQHVNRRAKTKSGKTYTARMTSPEVVVYREEVRRAVRVGHRVPPGLCGRLSVTILACPPSVNRLRDLDNLWKVTLDALKLAGVVRDDSLFDHEQIFRGAPFYDRKGRLLVSIEHLDEAAALSELRDYGLSGDPGAFELDIGNPPF